jgi:3-dehydroquinate synthase
MNFSVNNTVFNKNFNNSNIINVKSYNKIYDVVYDNKNLSELINITYEDNDFILIDRNVYNLDRDCIDKKDKKNYFIFDAIENNKTIDSVLLIIDLLFELKFNKKNKLIVIGGGITQDVGGFVSAIYKRGIKWIFIPTTLLSMTDSAIGGKVGINRNSKNILALFVSPNKIYISDYFLKSLKNEDIISGLGESLKLCLTSGKDEYDYFKDNFEKKNYIDIIKISSSIKKIIIEHDELEVNERKVLNYGHTLGHALETASNYYIPHGIAVLFGMYMINRIFYNDKYIELNNYIIEIIPNKFKKINISYNIFLNQILNDKKNDGDNVCFILLDDYGKSIFIYKKLIEINNTIKEVFDDLFINEINNT